ncbi:MAG: hypothetical protein DRN30_05205 [Thermoplasmata archaeon]|nr:GTP-binding protein [Euryarchaeota archaeon]RLF64661.1 MAG: hypothetical protein DRN30_05205 [Thermoplasmata archaeon]
MTPNKFKEKIVNIQTSDELSQSKLKELIEKNLILIDGYSSLIGAEKIEGVFYVDNPSNIESWIKQFDSALKEAESRNGAENTFIVIPYFSVIIDISDEKTGLDLVKYLKETVHKVFSVIIAIGKWPYTEDFWNEVRALGFDVVIEASRYIYKLREYRYFRIKHCSWRDSKEISQNKYLFRVEIPGPGFTVYIPKVVITGPYNSGKSTFVSTISKSSVSVDFMGTTVALDFGILSIGGISAHVFGTPGQERFDEILSYLAKEALGVILIVDSTRPETFDRAKEMLEKLYLRDVPIVVAANKQDLEGALPPEKVRELLNLPKGIPVVPTVAYDKERVFRVFEKLYEMISKSSGGCP